MLHQMLVVIRGMKDVDKLGKLQGAVLARICEVNGVDPVAHLEHLKRNVSQTLSHKEADLYAQRYLGNIEPEPGESPEQYRHRLITAKALFRERYPNWNGR
jgi:hypothetical protein